jgi:hypothetical protein
LKRQEDLANNGGQLKNLLSQVLLPFDVNLGTGGVAIDSLGKNTPC